MVCVYLIVEERSIIANPRSRAALRGYRSIALSGYRTSIIQAFQGVMFVREPSQNTEVLLDLASSAGLRNHSCTTQYDGGNVMSVTSQIESKLLYLNPLR
jgi:hypothetical protein